MTSETVIVTDPTIIESLPDEDHVTFVVDEDENEEYTLSEGTTVEGVGEHYFSGVVSEISYDTSDLGVQHHWVSFTDTETGRNGTLPDPHILPLGEVAEQISENDLTVTPSETKSNDK